MHRQPNDVFISLYFLLGQMDCVWRNDRNLYNYVLSRQVPHMIFKDKPVAYQIIITDPHEILLFSLHKINDCSL